MEQQNKVYMAIAYDGQCYNVEAEDIIEAGMKAAAELGRKNIFQIVDIPG